MLQDKPAELPLATWQSNSVSVILPVYKTAWALEELHRRLSDTLRSTSYEYELIFVDDGSPDEAWAILSDLSLADPHVRAIRFSRNFGQHSAISAGFRAAKGAIVVLMDADLEDQPEELPRMLAYLADHPEIEIIRTVKCTPDGQDKPSPLSSRIYHAIMSRLGRNDAPPVNVGTYSLFRSHVVRAMNQYQDHSLVYGSLFNSIGFRKAFLNVVHQDREAGGSSYTFRARLQLAMNAIVAHTDLPYKLLLALGSLTTFLAFSYGVVVLAQYLLIGRKVPPGITLIILITSFSLGINMISMGTLGMYIYRVYQESLNRPRYLIAEELNANFAVASRAIRE